MAEEKKMKMAEESTVLLGKLAATQKWLKTLQEKASEQFRKTGFPRTTHEAWKYLNVQSLVDTNFVLPVNSGEVPEELIKNYLFEETQSSTLTFSNNQYCEKLSSVKELPEGVIFEKISSSLQKHEEKIKPFLGMRTEEETNPFVSINTACFQEGVFLYVPKDTSVKLPFHTLFAGSKNKDGSFVAHPRILIVVDEGAKVSFVLDHIGIDEEQYFMNTVTEVHLGKNSKIDFFSIQREKLQTSHFLTTHVYLQEGSSFNGVCYVQGGSVRRDDFEFYFEGENAFASIDSLGVLTQDSKAFSHVVMHHRKPHGTSKQVFKNVLTDKAQAEFNSLVHVYPQAKKSDSNQLNRNLLLSDAARAYSRPQLRIDVDEVECSHGSAIGQLEDDEIFYLQSRGLSKELARFVMTFGFAEDVLEGITIPSLKKDLECELRVQLGKMMKNSVEGRG